MLGNQMWVGCYLKPLSPLPPAGGFPVCCLFCSFSLWVSGRPALAMSGQGAINVGGRRRQPRRPKGTPNSIAGQLCLTGKPGRDPTESGRPGNGLQTAGGATGTPGETTGTPGGMTGTPGETTGTPGHSCNGRPSVGTSAAGPVTSALLTGCRPTGSLAVGRIDNT